MTSDEDPLRRSEEVSRLRRGAHAFLRRYAAPAWEQQDGWEIFVPPEIDRLPERRRWRTHARQETRRLADAELYDVCPHLTERAVLLGAAIREDRHEEAAALAGHRNVVETLGIQAPATSGFLRWRDPYGISCNVRGAPIIACHWGPATGAGRWVVWWSDNYAMAKGYAAEAAGHGRGEQGVRLGVGVLSLFGALWYDDQELLYPLDDETPAPDPAPADPTGDDPGGDTDPARNAQIYTTLATWWLLTTPDTAIDLTRQPLPAAEQAADRAAGLRSRPVTLASAVMAP